jgi:hypothetical protein
MATGRPTPSFSETDLSPRHSAIVAIGCVRPSVVGPASFSDQLIQVDPRWPQGPALLWTAAKALEDSLPFPVILCSQASAPSPSEDILINHVTG